MSEHFKRSKRAAFALFAGLAAAGGGASAQLVGEPSGPCSPEVQNAPDVAIIEYDPFLPGATVRELVFDVSVVGEACVVDFAVLDAAENPSRLFALGDLVLDIGPSEEDGQLLPTERVGVYQLSLSPEAPVRVALDVAITRGAVIDAGDHLLEPRFEFYETGTIKPVGDRWLSAVLVRSLPRAQLNITGAAGSFGTGSSVSTVDFGDAESGAERRIFLQIRANTLSRLTLESENTGRLVHTANEAAPPIVYSVMLDGEPIDLTEAVSQDRDPPRTLEGQALPVDIKLGSVVGAMAGRYEDVLTIEFSPL